MYQQLRPWIFRSDAEAAHAATLWLLQVAGAIPPIRRALFSFYSVDKAPAVEVFGLRFPNRVGLAAGYDKDGLAWRGLAALGFGHIEIGTVTLKPQLGNQRPRLFRLVEDQGLINRLGFPSRGAAFVQRRLLGERAEGLIIGVNLGINKDTPIKQAAKDYAQLMGIFSPLADYLVINVSSPNTPGLRKLENSERLAQLLSDIKSERSKPLLVKLSPDLEQTELRATLDVLLDAKIDGLIASNTTLDRPRLLSQQAIQTGGLSGKPLYKRSLSMIKFISGHSQGKLPIVAVGGIMGPAEAQDTLDAGASLVQLYSGLVYQGPGLVKKILSKLK